MFKAEIENIEPTYIHSSNALFNFMKEDWHLEDALSKRRLAPRYYEEDIDYLNIMNEDEIISKVTVLQKCFCDIPLHSIAERFPLTIIDDISSMDNKEIQELSKGSTHTDFYGKFGIAFSKSWAQERNLQPVHYINRKSSYANQFKNVFEFVAGEDNIDDVIVSDIISRLAYFKPLSGVMVRNVDGNKIHVIKNFHDECEWRFVPKEDILEKYHISSVIFDEETLKLADDISNRLATEKYQDVWLDFDYQDIRYLIVPNNSARRKLIDFIMNLEIDTDDNVAEKYILISKILVLEDIIKDF